MGGKTAVAPAPSRELARFRRGYPQLGLDNWVNRLCSYGLQEPVFQGCQRVVWLLNLNRIQSDSQERWMILVECNMARSVFILN